MWLWVRVGKYVEANNLQDEVAAARPDIDEKTAQLVSKGRWAVPGYKVCPDITVSRSPLLQHKLTILQEKFGDLSLL